MGAWDKAGLRTEDVSIALSRFKQQAVVKVLLLYDKQIYNTFCMRLIKRLSNTEQQHMNEISEQICLLQTRDGVDKWLMSVNI